MANLFNPMSFLGGCMIVAGWLSDAEPYNTASIILGGIAIVLSTSLAIAWEDLERLDKHIKKEV